MTDSFFDVLAKRAEEVGSLLCVGLDPRANTADELRRECFRLIQATAEVACAFKPNSAFFEALGPEGWSALRDVIARVPAGIPVILDAKRGDIADTAKAYARAAFDMLGAHALTVSPYLGGDSLAPFLKHPERGVFVLCKTSNAGADEFQGLPIEAPNISQPPGASRALFEIVAEHAQRWNLGRNVGLVVGATDPTSVARVRALAPDLWFLVPGVGAQGGDLAAALAAGLRSDGLGLLINVSRSIARAADPRAEAGRLRDDINRHRSSRLAPPPTVQLSRGARERTGLARDLITSGCVRFGQFTLKSGVVSPIYLDLRRLVSHPEVLQSVARAYAQTLAGLNFDRLAGIPYAGLPIATAVALEMRRPLIYPRREAKDYGTRAAVEGDFKPGEIIAVIDDLATTGDTKIESIQKLEAAGLIVRDIVVLIDRGQGAREMLASAGYRLHAVSTLRELLDAWRSAGDITPETFAEINAFLEGSRS